MNGGNQSVASSWRSAAGGENSAAMAAAAYQRISGSNKLINRRSNNGESGGSLNISVMAANINISSIMPVALSAKLVEISAASGVMSG